MTRPSYKALGLSVPVLDLIDPQKWRERYAWGVALGGQGTSDHADAILSRARLKGGRLREREASRLIQAIPDDVIRWHLRAAVSELEMKIGMPIGLEVCKSKPVDAGLRKGLHYDREVGRLPYTQGAAQNFYRIDLPSGIISVERVRAFYLGMKIWEISDTRDNSDNIVIEWGKSGVIHLMPVHLQSMIVTQATGAFGVWHTMNLYSSPIPDVWAVDYTRGPVSEHGGEPGKIEAVLAHWAFCVAGITLLSMGGLAASKGLTSTSISMDGVSRSIGLQASAIYGLNSALEHVFDEATKRINWQQLRTQKRGLKVFPFSD